MLLWVSPSLKVQSWLRIEPNASSFDSVASSATLRSTYTIICFSWHKNAQQQPKHTQTSLKCKPFKITLNMCQTHVASLVIAPVWNANMWIHCPTPTVWFHKVQLFFFFFLNKHLVTRCCNCLKRDYNLHVWTLSCILLYDYLLLLRSTSVSVYTWFFAMFLSRYMGEVYNSPTDKTEVKSLFKETAQPKLYFCSGLFFVINLCMLPNFGDTCC